MIFAQFYDRKLDGTLGEALGDRSVVVFDGRLAKATITRLAGAEAEKRGYKAYSIHSGRSFTDSQKLSGPWAVPGQTDRTAASASYGG